MTQIPQSPTEDFTSTTLSSAVNDSTTTISVDNAATIVTPCYAVIDREDSNGVATPAAREVIYVSSKSSNDLTVTRGVDGSTARSHNASAKLEPLITVGFWDDFYDAYDNEHNPFDGSHDITKVAVLSGATVQTLAGKILSTPTITTPNLGNTIMSNAILSNPTIALGSLSSVVISSPTITLGSLSSPAITYGSLTSTVLTGTTWITKIRTHAYLGANQALSNATLTRVALATVAYDPGSYFDATNNKFTAPINGYYSVSAHIYFDGNNTGYRNIVLAIDGTPVQYDIPEAGKAFESVGGGSLSWQGYLTAAQYLQLFAWQNSTGALNVGGGGVYQTYLNVHLLSV